MTKRRIRSEPIPRWHPADEAMVIAQYPHMKARVIARMLECTESRVYQKAKKLGLSKSAEFYASPASGRTNGRQGASNRFQKGHVPANKGLRRPGWGPGRMKATQFKPGTLHGAAAHNWKPVGSTRINSEGYLDIKIDDLKKGALAWVAVHRLNWIAVHGPIPKGYFVRFRDGNPRNPLVENLELVDRATHLARNWHDRYPLELRQITQLRGAITRQINKRMRREKQD